MEFYRIYILYGIRIVLHPPIYKLYRTDTGNVPIKDLHGFNTILYRVPFRDVHFERSTHCSGCQECRMWAVPLILLRPFDFASFYTLGESRRKLVLNTT